MQEPLLEFAAGKDGKYAVRATIVPTFDERQDFFQIVWDKEPPVQRAQQGCEANNFHFVFICDVRSSGGGKSNLRAV